MKQPICAMCQRRHGPNWPCLFIAGTVKGNRGIRRLGEALVKYQKSRERKRGARPPKRSAATLR